MASTQIQFNDFKYLMVAPAIEQFSWISKGVQSTHNEPYDKCFASLKCEKYEAECLNRSWTVEGSHRLLNPFLYVNSLKAPEDKD